MKAISTLALFAVAAAFITPNSARAGDKEKAIIGGLIGGIIIGAVIADDHVDTHVSVGYHSSGHHGSHGYWEWVSVKRWSPGYYERSCDRHGHVRKTWVSGHYTWTKKKVWVDSHRPSHRGHSFSHDRGHHGSNHSHYDNRRDNYRTDNRSDKRDNRHDRSSQVVRRF